MHIEELGSASIQTNALALVEFTLEVVGGDALVLAHLVESVLRSARKLNSRIVEA